jgi:hypothetical protein
MRHRFSLVESIFELGRFGMVVAKNSLKSQGNLFANTFSTVKNREVGLVLGCSDEGNCGKEFEQGGDIVFFNGRSGIQSAFG